METINGPPKRVLCSRSRPRISENDLRCVVNALILKENRKEHGLRKLERLHGLMLDPFGVEAVNVPGHSCDQFMGLSV
jgi:hypothetical protein